MERFRAAHVTASKELKKRKGFRSKLRNVLSTKINKNELSARKLGASGLGVLPVDVNSWRLDPKKLKKNKLVDVQFITDVTSKILQSAEAVTLRDDTSYKDDAVHVNLPPEIVAEVKTDTLNKCCNPLRESLSDVQVQAFSASVQEPVSDIYEASQNESEKLDGVITSKSSGKRTKKRKKKSNIVECSVSELVVTGNVTSHCEEIKSNINVLNVSAVNHSVSASDSAVHISPPPHNANTEERLQSFDMKLHSSDICEGEPLIVRSDGLSTMKNFITARLESVGRTGKGDRNYVTELTQSMREILCSRSQKCNDTHGIDKRSESGGVTSASDATAGTGKVPHTFVREKFESLCIEESNDCGVSVLRDIFHSYSKAESMASTAGDSDVCDTNGPQIDLHCLKNNRFLLILRNGNCVYIRGNLTVSVIVGCAEILGFRLTASNGLEKYTVFSPRGVSLLSIISCVSDNAFASGDALQSICAHNQLPGDLVDSLCESDCVLLLEKAESNVADYLSLHLPNKLFPNLSGTKVKKKYSFAEKKLECEFLSGNLEEHVKLLCKGDDWNNLSDAILSKNCINETNCTVICGGKGVGKSTLLRFLINRSLSSHEKILCLDFDLGQAEFTVPGCISAVIIKKPLLGPNFTHILQAERMVYIGDVNVINCLTQYLEGAKFIIDYCKSQSEYQHIPWFVNTMGFCKGLGVEIMMNLLHMVSPTNVIQLQSRSNKRNFPKHLEAEYVRNYKNSLKYLSNINRNLFYDLHLLPSVAESKSEGQEAEWGLDSRTMREILIMSYLSGMTAPPNFSLPEIVPYVCGFKDLKLCVSHETINPNTVLSVMNGNFVALCICDKGEMLQPSDPNLPCILLHAPVCQCLGFGIIRGVDMEERQLYLISPLPEDKIQKVNCLVMGTVQLPSNVLLREATCDIIGHVPYTVIGPGQPTGRLSQKSSCHFLLSSAVGL